jgi:uncharacterized protein
VTPVYDSEGLRVLTERECRELLATAPVGRIVYTDRALPAIQPVTFTVTEDEVVIPTPAGSKLAAATHNAIVAFETDDFTPDRMAGWSVVIVGHTRVVTRSAELDRVRPLTPWPKDDPIHYIAITPELITGRRLPEPPQTKQRTDETPARRGA